MDRFATFWEGNEISFEDAGKAFKNIFSAARIKSGELFQFAFYSWWWKLTFVSNALYLWDSCYRLTVREHKNFPGYSLDQFGYGETPPSTLKKILDPLKPRQYERFVDLGSGRGVAVLGAHFLYDIPSTGIELLPSYVKRSKKLADMIGAKEVEFIQKDILAAELPGKAIYFSASTAFDKEFVRKMAVKLRGAPVDSIIIMVHNQLEGLWFELFHEIEALFTWGRDRVCYYRRTAVRE